MASKTVQHESDAPVRAKGVVMAASVPQHLADFLESVRWEKRLRKSDVVLNALREWADANGYDENADYTV